MCFLFVLISTAYAENGATKSELRVQFTTEPTQYDPLFMEDGVALRIAANTLGTLYEYNGNGDLQKGLVSDVSVSSDRKQYTFRFRPGLKWSDGNAFHADQFVLALKRLAEAPIKVALSSLFPEIDLKKTEAKDSVTAVVYLQKPDAQFLTWLTLPPFAPIRSDMIRGYQGRPNPVVPTLGAYQIEQYKREDFLLLKKNPHFYEESKVKIEKVKIRFIKDDAALVVLLKQNRLDILNRVPVLQVEELKKFAQVISRSVQAVTYLGFNVKQGPFANVENRKRVRDALFMKKFDLAAMLKTDEMPSSFFIPMALWPNIETSHYSDVVLSKGAPLTFTAQSDVGSRNQIILEWAQSELKKQLGWTMKIDMMEWKAHYSKLKTEPADLFRFGWQNPVGSPYVLYQVLQSKSPNNLTGWANSDYDRLVDQLRQELDPSKQKRMVENLEEIIYREVPVVPVLHQVLRFAISKRVEGFRANPFGVILFRELHLAR